MSLLITAAVALVLLLGLITYYRAKESSGTGRRNFYRDLRPEQLPLYQSAFDRLLAIGKGEKPGEDENQPMSIILGEAAHAGLRQDYLVIMYQQYALADEREREDWSDHWVRVVTGAITTAPGRRKAFFPPAWSVVHMMIEKNQKTSE